MRLMDMTDCLPGLLPAAFRGVPFWVINSNHEAGRRAAQIIFAGRDGIYHDDLGVHTGPVSLSALVIGDDYIAQAKRLKRALDAPGPGTLVHPWLGELWVVTNTPANIGFESSALRVATFDMIFEEDAEGASKSGSSLAALTSSIGNLFGIAGNLMSSVMGASSLSLAQWTAGRDLVSEISGIIGDQAAARQPASVYVPAITPALEIIEQAVAATPGTDNALACATGMVAAAQALVTAARAPLKAAIGRPVTALQDADNAADGADLALQIVSTVASLDTYATTDKAVAIAAEAAMLAGAVTLVSEISFESRAVAQAWRSRIDDGLAGCLDRIVTVAPAIPALAADLRNVILSVRSAYGRDMSETIGRLPAVMTITPRDTVSGWLLAQHFVGDDPSAVVPFFVDLARRNRLPHPGAIPADPIEVLV